MKITRENYKTIIPKKEQNLLKALLDDLDDINKYHNDNKLYIDWQEWHDEYSCERTDPCPDYYGYYSVKFENLPNETVGTVMTINDLDSTLCILFSYNYLQNMGSEINKSIVV
jgi:hypothetical protein